MVNTITSCEAKRHRYCSPLLTTNNIWQWLQMLPNRRQPYETAPRTDTWIYSRVHRLFAPIWTQSSIFVHRSGVEKVFVAVPPTTIAEIANVSHFNWRWWCWCFGEASKTFAQYYGSLYEISCFKNSIAICYLITIWQMIYMYVDFCRVELITKWVISKLRADRYDGAED